MIPVPGPFHCNWATALYFEHFFQCVWRHRRASGSVLHITIHSIVDHEGQTKVSGEHVFQLTKPSSVSRAFLVFYTHTNTHTHPGRKSCLGYRASLLSRTFRSQGPWIVSCFGVSQSTLLFPFLFYYSLWQTRNDTLVRCAFRNGKFNWKKLQFERESSSRRRVRCVHCRVTELLSHPGSTRTLFQKGANFSHTLSDQS